MEPPALFGPLAGQLRHGDAGFPRRRRGGPAVARDIASSRLLRRFAFRDGRSGDGRRHGTRFPRLSSGRDLGGSQSFWPFVSPVGPCRGCGCHVGCGCGTSGCSGGRSVASMLEASGSCAKLVGHLGQKPAHPAAVAPRRGASARCRTARRPARRGSLKIGPPESPCRAAAESSTISNGWLRPGATYWVQRPVTPRYWPLP